PRDVLEVTLSRANGRWLGTIALRDAAGALLGERSVQTDKPRCEDLEAALVLIISLPLTTPAALPAEEPPPPRRPLQVHEPTPEPPPSPPRWRVAPRASLAAAWGELPSFSAGAELTFAVQRGEG